jgi:hypothetical protein
VTVDIIPRRDWCNIAPNGTPHRMQLPAPRVWLHHGAGGSSTIATANSYARYHIATNGWQDIGYSFVIAEGKVLEGRGAGRVGAHTHGDNSRSHVICMAGNYQNAVPADRDLDALRWLLSHGAERGWWASPKLTGGHRDAPGASTACPGSALHRLIPTINAAPEGTMTPAQEQKLDRLLTEVAWIKRALGSRYEPGSQGGDEQLTVGHDLLVTRRQTASAGGTTVIS